MLTFLEYYVQMTSQKTAGSFEFVWYQGSRGVGRKTWVSALGVEITSYGSEEWNTANALQSHIASLEQFSPQAALWLHK